MAITIYGIKNCDTMKKARAWLEEKGVPGMVQRTLIRPPFSRMGPLTDAERVEVMKASAMAARYAVAIDRDSAHERLARRTEEAARAKEDDALFDMDRDEYRNARRYRPRDEARPARVPSSRSDSIVETFGKSLARQLGTKSGQAIVRGVLGSLFRGR